MTNLRKAAQEALEFLDEITLAKGWPQNKYEHAVAASKLRAALATFKYWVPWKPSIPAIDAAREVYRECQLSGVGECTTTTRMLEKAYSIDAKEPISSQPRVGPEPATSFQSRVNDWMQECFGPEISKDGIERNHRFLEESLELVQSLGCTASEAHQLVDYVYGRPVGEPHQEVGGVMVTLAALCLAHGLDMQKAGEDELARIWTKVEAIRAKQAAKPKHSPLPQAAARAPLAVPDPQSPLPMPEYKFQDGWLKRDMDKAASRLEGGDAIDQPTRETRNIDKAPGASASVTRGALPPEPSEEAYVEAAKYVRGDNADLRNALRAAYAIDCPAAKDTPHD